MTQVYLSKANHMKNNVCQLLNEELEKCDIWIKANKQLALNLKKNTFHDFPYIENKI